MQKLDGWRNFQKYPGIHICGQTKDRWDDIRETGISELMVAPDWRRHEPMPDREMDTIMETDVRHEHHRNDSDIDLIRSHLFKAENFSAKICVKSVNDIGGSPFEITSVLL